MIDLKIKQEAELAAKRANEIIEKARNELIKEAEYLRQNEIKFNEQLRKERQQVIEDNKDMVDGMNAKRVDLTNYNIYVQEFYDKMNDLYIKDYENRIQDLESINIEIAKKREHYDKFKTMEKPKEEVKIKYNPDKIEPFKGRKDKLQFHSIGGSDNEESNLINPITMTIGFISLLAGGYIINN